MYGRRHTTRKTYSSTSFLPGKPFSLSNFVVDTFMGALHVNTLDKRLTTVTTLFWGHSQPSSKMCMVVD